MQAAGLKGVSGRSSPHPRPYIRSQPVSRLKAQPACRLCTCRRQHEICGLASALAEACGGTGRKCVFLFRQQQHKGLHMAQIWASAYLRAAAGGRLCRDQPDNAGIVTMHAAHVDAARPVSRAPGCHQASGRQDLALLVQGSHRVWSMTPNPMACT